MVKTLNFIEEMKKRLIIQHAEKATEKYPQYRGHWNDHELIRVRRTIRTKLGVAFEAGDVTVGKTFEGAFEGAVAAWSMRNKSDTLIRRADVEFLERKETT